MLLASLLRAQGHAAHVFPAESPAALGGHRVAFRDAAVVCLSLISTGSPARARFIVRRLRRRAPRARMLLGFWGFASDDTGAATAADAVATTLADAIADIDRHMAAAAPLVATLGGESTAGAAA